MPSGQGFCNCIYLVAGSTAIALAIASSGFEINLFCVRVSISITSTSPKVASVQYSL